MNSKIPNPNEVLENAKRLFFILLVIDIAITLLVGVNSISTIGMLSDVKSGVKVVDEQLLSSLASRDNFSKLLILSMSGVGIGLVKWLNVCYGFAKESLGATGFKNERWTTTGWLIPFFNLVKPYQIVNEIYKAGSPVYTAPDGWQKESSSGILLTWWVFWALTHLIGASVSKQLLKHDTFSLRQAIDSTELQVAICVVSVVVAGMWFVVSNHLTQRLLIRASSPHNPVKVSPQDCFSPTPPEASNARGNLAGVVAHPDGGDTSFASDALPRHAAQRSAHAETQIPSSKTSLINDSPIAQVLESFYDSVGKELEDGKPDRATWTRAFAESDGDDAKASAAYIRLRVAKLAAAYQAEKVALAEALFAKRREEGRRLSTVEAKAHEGIHLFSLVDEDNKPDLNIFKWNDCRYAIANGLTKIFIFTGRASRAEFWWLMLLVYPAASLFALLYDCLTGSTFGIEELILIPFGGWSRSFFPFHYFFVLFIVAVSVRRMHDVDKKDLWKFAVYFSLRAIGIFIVIYLISILSFSYVLYVILKNPEFLLPHIVLLILGLRRSNSGDNKYGESRNRKSDILIESNFDKKSLIFGTMVFSTGFVVTILKDVIAKSSFDNIDWGAVFIVWILVSLAGLFLGRIFSGLSKFVAGRNCLQSS